MKYCVFDDRTKDYLCCYYSILDNMIQSMEGADVNDSVSHNFIVQMIPHHQAAVEMSDSLLQYCSWPPLRRIAANIISSQTKSISEMCRVLECCCEPSACCDLMLYQRQQQNITHAMFCEMNSARSSNNINASFMRQMIPHHLGAIRMAENALHFELCPDLIPILEAIIVSQRSGVQEMQHLLRRTGC